MSNSPSKYTNKEKTKKKNMNKKIIIAIVVIVLIAVIVTVIVAKKNKEKKAVNGGGTATDATAIDPAVDVHSGINDTTSTDNVSTVGTESIDAGSSYQSS